MTPSPTTSPLLECQQLAFERDDVPLFSGVSFSVQAGQAVQVRGVNGAGKTTLLRIIATSLLASEGDILWRGLPISRQMSDYRSQLLHLGHSAGVKAALTPLENLRWYFQLFPSNQSCADLALQKVGLNGYQDSPCHTLSAGQLRRVALARLYLSSAKLWVLDEPFTSIDVNGIAQIEALMASHLALGGSIILTSHQQPKLVNLAAFSVERHGNSQDGGY